MLGGEHGRGNALELERPDAAAAHAEGEDARVIAPIPVDVVASALPTVESKVQTTGAAQQWRALNSSVRDTEEVKESNGISPYVDDGGRGESGDRADLNADVLKAEYERETRANTSKRAALFPSDAEDALEREILFTEKSLRNPSDCASAHDKTAAAPSPATPAVEAERSGASSVARSNTSDMDMDESSTSEPAAPIGLPHTDPSTEREETDALEAILDEEVEMETPAPDTNPLAESAEVKSAIQSLAKQLVAQYPLAPDYVCSLYDENRNVAASLTVPTCLASTKSGALAPPLNFAIAPMLASSAQARASKAEALRVEYRKRHTAWKSYCARLDEIYERREAQRRAMQGPAESESGLNSVAPSVLSTPLTSRGSRRSAYGAAGFGDAVRSEAEFLEILASLESAEMQDPVVRAKRTAATEPDMAIRLPEDPPLPDEDNGFVADFRERFFPDFDPDVWSDEERAIFMRRYAKYPKQFGRIASGLPHKTSQQCVVYYYLHKHSDGYGFKSLNSRKRERKRKPKVRAKKAKGSALMADMAPAEEQELDDTPDTPDVPDVPKHLSDAPIERPRIASSAKRAKATPKRQRSAVEDAAESLSQLSSVVATKPETEMDRDLAAAEALEALASVGTSAAARKKRARAKPKREGDETRSRSRGPHWSMTERAEFLRLLALHGKDWVALAATFSSKTPAQARNFFARHASESPHFQSAAALAVDNAALPWEERVRAAVDFVNAWYASLPTETQANVEGWPSDVARFLRDAPHLLPEDFDETDDEDGAQRAEAWEYAPAPALAPAHMHTPAPAQSNVPYHYPPRAPMYYREGYDRYLYGYHPVSPAYPEEGRVYTPRHEPRYGPEIPYYASRPDEYRTPRSMYVPHDEYRSIERYSPDPTRAVPRSMPRPAPPNMGYFHAPRAMEPHR
ncbi:DNA-binding protein snt1 [Malassezia vespertilionis]|uniref:SANT domain-containing protein n=1 Tax=Malassezia vespertilionis TaxID=2020962 RepID=A0A2N1J8Q1_9BASI|nr:DNA-binding protein snt1 [Malassezia vespertilionis]PKI82916.1 hypothetical protein MVES_003199 [Malassezia vespertilionis]WFD08256.1 DNA-binding protein snt1 [Malassezia vespertilionis]